MKLIISISLVLMGCGLLGQSWSISDVTVQENGVERPNAWAGGLSAPQFWPLDFDRDGDHDLLVFDRVGNRLMMFETDPSSSTTYRYRYDWERTFPFFNQFAIPRDYTGDGIPDIFAYAQNGIPGMQLYKGRQEGGELRFELVVLDQDFQNVLIYKVDNSLLNININRIDLPCIADVNEDGDLDILSFPSSGGTMYYYENQQQERGLEDDAIYFELVDQCFAGFFESDFSEEIFLAPSAGACASDFFDGASERHNGSTTMFWDRDGDGVEDLLIGDFTSNSMVSLDLEREGDTYWATGQDINFPSYERPIDMSTFLASFLFDVNQDGKEDVLVAPNIRNASRKANNVLYYENVGSDSFDLRFRADDFLSNTMIELGLRTSPTFMDVNADGWMDIITGTEGENVVDGADPASLVYYRHNGDSDNPQYVLETNNWLNFRQFSSVNMASFSPTFGDMDADGDLDLVVGDQDGQLFYVQNTAGAEQPFASNVPVVYPWFNIDVGQFAAPEVYDVNGDDLPDLMIGERNANNDPNTNSICATVNYFQNVGSAAAPNFGADVNNSPNSGCLGFMNTRLENTISGFATPAVYDIPGEDPILLVGMDAGIMRRYEVGDANEEWMVLDSVFGGVDVGAQSKADLADVDGDGFLEMIVGGQGGGLSLFNTPYRTDGTFSSVANPDIDPSDDVLRVYPNPVRPLEYVQVDQTAFGDLRSISLLDVNGQIRGKWRPSDTGTFLVPAVPSGIYVLRMEFDEHVEFHKLLIIN